MDNSNYALQMQDITVEFPGVLANNHVSIDCKKGEVLGLLGENGAGKTTLMNVLYGLYEPTTGKVFLDGKEVHITSPLEAIKNGIGMVHQHFKLVDTLSVIENVILGIKDDKQRLDLESAKKRLLELCEEYELYVDPDEVVWRLPVGKQQWVEILKALYRDCKLLILDEPTAVLTPSESDQLCKAIHKITESGRAVIFISHKLREVIEITDRVTVLRDGNYIGTVDTKDATQVTLAEMMVGRPVTIERKARPVFEKKEPILVMKDVNANDDRGIQALKNFNLTVHSGEIVGVAGVDGNGQRELAECIVGLRKPTSGTVTIKDKLVTKVIADPSFVGFIPEDRQKTGLVMDFSIADNMIIKDYTNEPFAKNGVLNYKNIKSSARELIKKYNVKTPNEDVRVRNLRPRGQGDVHQADRRGRSHHQPLRRQPAEGGHRPRAGPRARSRHRGAPHPRSGPGRSGQRPRHSSQGTQPRRSCAVHQRRAAGGHGAQRSYHRALQRSDHGRSGRRNRGPKCDRSDDAGSEC